MDITRRTLLKSSFAYGVLASIGISGITEVVYPPVTITVDDMEAALTFFDRYNITMTKELIDAVDAVRKDLNPSTQFDLKIALCDCLVKEPIMAEMSEHYMNGIKAELIMAGRMSA